MALVVGFKGFILDQGDAWSFSWGWQRVLHVRSCVRVPGPGFGAIHKWPSRDQEPRDDHLLAVQRGVWWEGCQGYRDALYRAITAL